MGLFDIFKQKKSPQKYEYKPHTGETINQVSDADQIARFLSLLKTRLESEGHQAKPSANYASIILNDELEIAAGLLPGNYHPNLMPMALMTMHEDHFPEGIETSAIGLGTDIDSKCKMAIDNYVNSTLPAILDSMTDIHIEELDFESQMGDSKILWHPKLGMAGFQGDWTEVQGRRELYKLVQGELSKIMEDRKINWLYMYAAKQKDGSTSIECNVNNQRWQKGEELLFEYTQTWKKQKDFLGQKQFVVIRKCDASI